VQAVHEALSRALEFAHKGDLEQAQATLDECDDPLAGQLLSYFKQQQMRNEQRARDMQMARHELGNALSIAQASIEAMLDGVVGITDPRLNRLREILASVSAGLYALTEEE